jgi:hypothetical protein
VCIEKVLDIDQADDGAIGIHDDELIDLVFAENAFGILDQEIGRDRDGIPAHVVINRILETRRVAFFQKTPQVTVCENACQTCVLIEYHRRAGATFGLLVCKDDLEHGRPQMNER